ncbi:amino acid ABC transporter substrate-binding protein [Faecalicatena contorta]|uniref:amino acid ABC transporter substrate-binding protein n=1 Tax=Faecalicatena contorta TaxID=39482 RepID=UPI001896CE5D|nr:amino acid ABC transporter substrate-binding protein [Faecalicatena contorta]
MKRKLAVAMAAALVLTTALAGCGNKAEDTKSEGTKTEDTKTEDSAKDDEKTDGVSAEKSEGDSFTVGFDASFPPYGYKDDDGEYVGFDLDLAQEVCDRNGWELKKQPIDWDAKDMELSSGTIDCIWNGFTMNGREDDYTWSEPYVDNSQVVVVAEDSGIKTLEDLAGKIVEVQADSSALAALEGDQKELAGTFSQLTQVPDYNTAFMDLEAGAAEAVAMDVGVAEYQIESRGGGYITLDETISTEQYAVGFKKGNEKLRDQVQKTLNEMSEDGTFMTIAKKWGVEDAVCLGK